MLTACDSQSRRSHRACVTCPDSIDRQRFLFLRELVFEKRGRELIQVLVETGVVHGDGRPH